MFNECRWCALVVIAALLFAPVGVAQESKKPFPKHDGGALNDSLRDVINVGVKMFNDQGDYAGTYRLYQGSLLTVRPFVSPDLQKRIDTGITNAEKMRSYADRAYELRAVLDQIRASLPPGTPVADKKSGQVAGKLTFENAPVAGGYFVTLVNTDGKRFSSAIQKDGTFQFKTPLTPGEYRVAIEPIPGETAKLVDIPARYRSETTSGIRVNIQGGKQQVDFNLPR
jgi:hypothetical protein